VLVYVAIMAFRLTHIQRELGELSRRERAAASPQPGSPESRRP
jgi:hypothetical protein